MGFLSDDYCLVTGTEPVAHQLYSTARVGAHDVDRFSSILEPDVDPADVDEENVVDDKALYLVHAQRPAQVLTSAPVVGVVVLDRHRGGGPELVVERPAVALRALAPSTLWQLSLDPSRELAALADLVRNVPCHRLVLSGDRNANPPLLAGLLARR